MEPDKRYLLEGLFIVVLSIAAAVTFVWLSKTGHRDDVLYRIRFEESVSGLAPGEPVKYHGVDVGVVKSLSLDTTDPRKVLVNATLRKDTPVKADTRATLKLKGITGVVYIELSGGSPDSPALVASTAPGEIPEIVAQKSELAHVIDRLPHILEQLGAIGVKTQSVLKDAGIAAKNAKEASAEIREDPSRLIWKKKKEGK